MKEVWESGNRRQETEVRRPRTADKALALRTGKEYWRAKLAGNKARDLAVNRMLRRQGWRVVRIWEHELARKRGQRSAVRSQKTGDSGQGTRDCLKAVERIRMILRRAQDDNRVVRSQKVLGKSALRGLRTLD